MRKNKNKKKGGGGLEYHFKENNFVVLNSVDSTAPTKKTTNSDQNFKTFASVFLFLILDVCVMS